MNNRTPKRQPNTGRGKNPGRRNKPQVPVNKKPQVPVKKKPQKKKTTTRQAEAPHRRVDRNEVRRKKIIKQKRAEARKIFFNRVLMFFIVFIMLLAVSVGLFFFQLFMHDNITSLKYAYQIGASDDSSRTVKWMNYKSLYIDRNIYINMSELAGIYEFIITGDKDTVRFILLDDDGEVRDDVRFYLNTSFAYVNNVQVRLSSPIYEIGTNIYVPMKFFNDYISGLNVTFNKETSRLIIQPSSDKKTIYFNLSLDPETDNIPESSLDYETLYETDPDRLRQIAEEQARIEAQRLAGDSTE